MSIGEAYGLQQSHNPDLLVERVAPKDIYAASDRCFAQANVYQEEGSERFYQGAVLADFILGWPVS